MTMFWIGFLVGAGAVLLFLAALVVYLILAGPPGSILPW